MPPRPRPCAADKLIIVAPDPRRHGEAVFDLIAKIFSGRGGYFGSRQRGRRCYIGNSHYDWSATRIGLLDGQLVTHYGVWDYRMRIGRGRVRVGGIGAVSTHGDYRKRGYMARTVEAAIEAMRQQGYDMTVLFGISDFYHRFGYVRAWSDTTITVPVASLPSDRPGGPLRPFGVTRPRDDLARLYNRTHARLTGTAVRPTYRRTEAGRDGWKGYLWQDAAGQPAGYVVVSERPPRLRCDDFAGPAEAVLAALAARARKRNLQKITFEGAHHDSEVCRRLRRGDCEVETQYCRNGGPMVRTLNLSACLTKMATELAGRLKRSHLARWRGKLLIADPREKVTLKIAAFTHERQVGPCPFL